MSDVALRLIVLRPLPGVALAVPDKHGGLLGPAGRGARSVWFDFGVRLNPRAAGPDFLGAFVHGPRGGRFVYVNAGKRAGQADSPWDRRAKVPLGGISAALLKSVLAKPGLLLAAAIAGSGGRDAGPTCATVPLASDWRLVRTSAQRVAERRAGVARAEI